jgi:hypothetical protein
MRFLHRLRLKALSISGDETTFRMRGFEAPTRRIQEHLETVGRTFVLGYHAALIDEPVEVLETETVTSVDLSISWSPSRV